jgi:hypothetical protein
MTQLLDQPRSQAETTTRRQEGDGYRRQASRVNVGPKERDVSMAAGAIVALQGLSRPRCRG